MKIGPMNDWNSVHWFLLGAVAFSAGSVGGMAFRLMALTATPFPKPLPLYFSPTDGLFFGALVPAPFYTIVKIASRPPPGKPGAAL